MENELERRRAGIIRVPVETLVELCRTDGSDHQCFQAESLDVSGRGMQLRTAYLPPLGATLVCRFQSPDGEILAEGVVVWRQELGRGGDFGLRFTALDEGCVAALKALLSAQLDSEEPAPAVAAPGEEPPLPEGSPVRLHLEGLGAPMKARVRGGGAESLEVSSKLEFLRVGRWLDVEAGREAGRRRARVNLVELELDASSGVPHLVVSLAFEGSVDAVRAPRAAAPAVRASESHVTVPMNRSARPVATPSPDPEPRVAPPREAAPPSAPHAAAPVPPPRPTMAAELDDEPYLDDDRLSDGDTEFDGAFDDSTPEALRERAGRLAQHTGARALEVVRGTSLWLHGTGKQVAAALRRPASAAAPPPSEAAATLRRQSAHAPRRPATPAPARHGAAAPEPPRLRPQQPGRGVPQPPAPQAIRPQGKQLLIAGSLLSVLLLGGVIMAAGGPDAAAVAAAASASAVPSVVASAKVPEVDPDAPQADESEGIVADVPMFGPQEVAGGEALADPEDAPLPTAKSAANESFDEGTKGDKSGQRTRSWGRGKLDRPKVSRLKLDGAGADLEGSPTAQGFSVLVPGRRALENGASIAKQDPRVARVRVTNGAAGATISFQFREDIPAYRVRLKDDYVEFLVSQQQVQASR